MKTPLDSAKGRIVGYDEKRGELLIRAKYDDIYTLTKRGYRQCTIQLIDNRTLSEKQRKCCYAMLNAISEFTGQGLDPTKEWTKIKFMTEDLQQTGDHIFSLSNAPMSLVCAYQKFLAHFIIDWEIPCKFSLVEYVDDIPDYVYHCAIKKRCCVCGRQAEPHHWDRIGSHMNRDKIDQTGMRMLPLCRGHHNECHSMIQSEFDDRYKLVPIRIDAALKKVWGFNGTKKRFEWIDSDEWFGGEAENERT